MRQFIESKIIELSEIDKDLSKLSETELMNLYNQTLAAALNYMYSSGYTEGYEEGKESQRNT